MDSPGRHGHALGRSRALQPAWPGLADGYGLSAVALGGSHVGDDGVAALAETGDRRGEHLSRLQVARRLAGVADAARGAGGDDVAGPESGHRGDVLDQGDRVEEEVAGGVLLDGLAIDL